MKRRTGSFPIGTALLTFTTVAALVTAAAARPAFTDDGAHPDKVTTRPQVTALKTVDPPVIDGQLDDLVWQQTPAYTDFRTFEPDFGTSISEPTFAYVAYDQENLYFAFRCVDSHPGEIKASFTKRDNIFSDDLVGIFLDTYNDCQGAYVFFANPYGIQGDIMMNAQGGGDPSSADFLWESKGCINEEGYCVEIKVPLQSLRFAGGDQVAMGLGLHRQIIRTSERTLYPEMVPGQGSLISQSAIVNYNNLLDSKVLEILPAATWTRQETHEDGTMHRSLDRQEFGVTAKIGLTPTLTLDGTYNPDFSQVEADARQIDEVNSRYAIFYSETRPFFVEGQEQFEFAGFNMASPIEMAVHTRTIVNPVAGGKISGKLGQHNTVASIIALDDYPGETGNNRAGIGIFRLKHLTGDDSYIGGLVTTRDMGEHYNRTAGIDIRQRYNNSLRLDGNVLASVSGNPENGSANGGTVNLFGNYEQRHLDIAASFHHVSKNFAIDPGYVRRTGVSSAALQIIRNFYSNDNSTWGPLNWVFRTLAFQNVRPGIRFEGLYDQQDAMAEGAAQLFLQASLPRSTSLMLSYTNASEIYAARSFDVDYTYARVASQPYAWLEIYASLLTGGYIYYDPDDSYQGDRTNVSLNLTLKATKDLSLDLTHSRSIFTRRSNAEQIYDFRLFRGKLTYQINKYLYVRGIAEYDAMNNIFTSDFLASFTYIPGTVIHLGYGSSYEKLKYMAPDYVEANRFMTMQKGLFLKASYNWIL